MENKWHKIQRNGYIEIINEGGKNIAYSPESGVKIIEQDGYAFKDLNGNGVLDPYEDWRLPIEDRVKDLASRMSIEQIAGLMLYSKHQTVTKPDPDDTFHMRFAGTYDGKPFDFENGDITQATDQQKEFLEKDKLRHILLTTVESAEVAAKWNNNIQAFCEGTDLGIPASISSDPRHGASSNGEFFVGSKGMISQWPSQLGLAASFDPELVENFGKILSKEYRGIGIVTAFSPQIDLATEPRWNRYNGTFGENSKLAADLARAYIDGAQTTEGSADGWGRDSVNAMAKHWPGGGTGEAGRDAHFSYGRYAVYPGNNQEEHLKPFIDGAFRLNGKTGCVSSIMPYYTISYNYDKKYGENVGNGFSKYIIKDLLREKYGYDGVVCTDWGIVDTCQSDYIISGMNWGTDHLNSAERHYKAIMAGVDQFGGCSDMESTVKAYEMGCAAYGEKAMRERMELSARRLLRNIFRLEMFENPYIDASESAKIVGCAEFMKAGYDAQKRSIVMLKNKDSVLPLKKGIKVYIPDCPDTWLYGMPALFAPDLHVPGHPWIDVATVGRYASLVKNPEEADAAIVFMENPHPMIPGYNHEAGYVPISLQYRPYTSELGREHSIAGGDRFCFENPDRSYRGKTNTTANESHLDVLEETRKVMGSKPVILIEDITGPMIFGEAEPLSDAVLVGFEIQKQAYMDMIFGDDEPSGLLPFQMPRNMDTVETQLEDVPGDCICYKDSCGNEYDFAFGMNFKGVINDERVRKYGVKKTDNNVPSV